MDQMECLEKEKIRRMMSLRKRSMTEEEVRRLSDELAGIFCSLEEFRTARCLFAYISFNQEVRTQPIIETALALGKRVAVPKVSGSDLIFRYITGLQDMEKSSFGILEPADALECADGKETDVLMLLPGLAFDRRGARVGYGKGYYDRYLSRFQGVRFCKIALCFPFQLVDYIAMDVHDQFADRVITIPDFGRTHDCL